MSHVLARLNGYGVQLVPYWPYRFERPDAAAADRVLVVRVMPDGDYGVPIDPADPVAVEGIVDVGTDPSPAGWRVETSTFSVPWPVGFDVTSPTDGSDRKAYYLLGPDDSAIFPQGILANDRVPTADALAAAGQRITGQRVVDEIRVIDLEYEHDGEPWWQSHWLVPWGQARTLVFTAQAPRPRAEATARAVELVARGSWPTGAAMP